MVQHAGGGTGGVGGYSEGQEEQEEETRAEREIREDLLRRTEEYGASGEEEGTQRAAVAGRLRAAQMAREALVVVQEGPTAEEKKKADLEEAASCRDRTEADRQYREQAAVGLEAAKRARMGRKEDGGGAAGAAGRRPGRVEQVLPGPPHIYTMYGTRVEALGSQWWHS